MSNTSKIHSLRQTIAKATKELRPLLCEAIRKAIRDITGGVSLNLQEFHSEEGIGDPSHVLVEVDRHTGDQAVESIDSVEILKNGEDVCVTTENGTTILKYMSCDEIAWLYDELEFIREEMKNPNWEFVVEEGKILLKTE